MKKIATLFWAVCIALPLFSQQGGIPNLKGYVTLKCDFHMHTVFSDGTVWPTVRVDEAYREGLDAIAITEHLENRRYLREIEGKSDIVFTNLSHHVSYDIAQPLAKERDIILIRGSEITRAMPPGHSNALFLSNSNELANKPDYMDAFRAAKAQDAFFFWNHPGWVAQQPDSTLWWPEHARLFEQGMMHSIEVVNGHYSPEAHRWCLEKNLTMIGNSDIHAPMQNFLPGQHRTVTLVFAKERSAEAIHEALTARRTAVYWGEYVIGEEMYLKELLENALEWKVEKTGNTVMGGEVVNITVRNSSDLTFRLKQANHDSRLVYFRNTSIEKLTVTPNGVQTFTVRLLDGISGGDVNFIVENFLSQPNTGMKYTIKIHE